MPSKQVWLELSYEQRARTAVRWNYVISEWHPEGLRAGPDGKCLYLPFAASLTDAILHGENPTQALENCRAKHRIEPNRRADRLLILLLEDVWRDEIGTPCPWSPVD